MANKDVRDWIDGIKAAGELKIITGAEPKEEIGGIVDIYMRGMGNPAVMFDEIPGFPRGYRVIANILTSIPRVTWRSACRLRPRRWSRFNGGAITSRARHPNRRRPSTAGRCWTTCSKATR